MKSMYFKGGSVKNDSPIGVITLDRRAKASELLWLSRAIEASGIEPDEITAVEGVGSVAFIERIPTKVVIPDA